MPFDPYRIIRRPLVTEKSTKDQTLRNQYAFEVAPEANKLEIKRAIQNLFNVRVVKVHTMNYRGKTRRIRYKIVRQPDWKKALITVAEGQSIEVA